MPHRGHEASQKGWSLPRDLDSLKRRLIKFRASAGCGTPPPVCSHLRPESHVTPEELKATINLPKTSFSMKANLPQREPLMLKEVFGRLMVALSSSGDT